MKNLLLVIAFVLCGCLNVFSQATSLTVDCQTPGWLSSKINYGDQQTIENLKVIGYINNTDLLFVGELIQNKLSIIDLSEVTITPLCNLPENAFGLQAKNQIQKLVLPYSQESAESRCLQNIETDTLILGSPKYHKLGGLQCIMKNCTIREGVDSISSLSNNSLEHILLPSSLRYIAEKTFYGTTNLKNVVFPDSLKEISKEAFGSSAFHPDTLFLPDGLEIFYIDAFGDIPLKVYYFGKNIKKIDNCKYNSSKYWDIANGGYHYYTIIDATSEVIFHIKSETPPFFNYDLSYNCLSNTTVYVPKGCVEKYKKTSPWSFANVIEEIYVEGLSLDKTKNLYVGDISILKAHLIPTDATNQSVKWESNNPSIVEVYENGTVKAIAYGTAVITATTVDGGYKDSITITVYEHTTGIDMVDKISIPINNTYTLNAKTLPLSTSDEKITYSSGNEEIATVNSQGVVNAKKKGTCIITATSVDGGYTATCQVTVTQPVETLTLEKHSTSLKVGETEKLFAQISPATANDKTISWLSSNDEVASVDENGNVTAKKAGEAWINAISNDNSEAKDSCIVIVSQPVTGIQLDNTTYFLNGIGKSFELKATVVPNDASNKNVKWKSSDESVCIVSQGLVVAVGLGTCVIIATTEDGGYMATCTVTVNKTTDISAVSSQNNNKFQVYDANGSKRNSLQQGVNIIRFVDGTKKKVIIR